MCRPLKMLMTKLPFIPLVLVAIFAVCGTARAQDPARAQISAATSNALRALRNDIRSTRISPTLTIAQFLDKTGAADLFEDTVQQAQQIGAPRWIDDQTCQVRLELSGAKVSYSLVAIAATRPRLSPIPAAVLEQTLSDWKRRSFGATGTSVSAAKVPGIRPLDVGERWNGISDEARSQALAEARQDAAQRVLDEIRPIAIDDGHTVGDLLTNEPVQKAVRSWVASQPVTQVRFGDDLQVELTVATPPDQLFNTVFDSAKAVPGTTLPSDSKTLNELEREFARRVSGTIGRASVTAPAASPTTQEVVRPVELPDRAPVWVSSLLDAEGTSPAMSSVLRTKSVAEVKATENLRARINALPLTHSMTLEDAAKRDPRIADAINRTLLRARVYKVEYGADQSMSVRMTIDSRDLWNDLHQSVER